MTTPRIIRRHLPPSARSLVALAIFILFIPSAMATLVLSDISFAPNPPLAPAQPQHATVTIAIIPSGERTFASGHEIQLQTGLLNARWNIQVIVDGLPAAHQTTQGSATFINGVILSYPTTRDVSLVIGIDGTVPANAGGLVMIMQAEEIDNNGGIVPGSVITITQQTTLSSVITASPTIPTIPLVTPVITTLPAPSPTRAPGFSVFGSIVALCIVAVMAAGFCQHSLDSNPKRP